MQNRALHRIERLLKVFVAPLTRPPGAAAAVTRQGRGGTVGPPGPDGRGGRVRLGGAGTVRSGRVEAAGGALRWLAGVSITGRDKCSVIVLREGRMGGAAVYDRPRRSYGDW